MFTEFKSVYFSIQNLLMKEWQLCLAWLRHLLRGKSSPKPKGRCKTRKYVILLNELIRKLGETVDSSSGWNVMKVGLSPHTSLGKQLLLILWVVSTRFLLEIFQSFSRWTRSLSAWLASCMKSLRAGKWDSPTSRSVVEIIAIEPTFSKMRITRCCHCCEFIKIIAGKSTAKFNHNSIITEL